MRPVDIRAAQRLRQDYRHPHARQAVEAGACAAEMSSLHLLGLLEDDDLCVPRILSTALTSTDE